MRIKPDRTKKNETPCASGMSTMAGLSRKWNMPAACETTTIAAAKNRKAVNESKRTLVGADFSRAESVPTSGANVLILDSSR